MFLLCDSWVISLLAYPVVFAALFYSYLKYRYTFWQRQGCPVPLEPHIIYGHTMDVTKMKAWVGQHYAKIYYDMEGYKFAGFYQFQKPKLMLRDLDIIREVFTKEFATFPNRGIVFDDKLEPLTGNLLTLEDHKWKVLRNKLTPAFTIGKIKNMVELIDGRAQEMVRVLESSAEIGDQVEFKELLARFSTDVISIVAFGFETNSLANPDAEFRAVGRSLFTIRLETIIRNAMNALAPNLIGLFKVRSIKKEHADFFYNVVNETVKYREENNVQRNDFLDLLLKIKMGHNLADDESRAIFNGNENKDDFEFTMDVLVAQCFVWFIGGYETSSITLTFTLFELTQNPEVQARVQEEIDTVLDRHGGKITYEILQEMTYLDMVVSEALRMYPPVPNLTRKTINPYKFADSDFTMAKGLQAVIPVYGIHRDPKYWPEPDSFIPERFTEDEKRNRHQYAYLPFGAGPRLCIGMRFGLMQIKTALARLLSAYDFTLSKSMELPIKMNPKSIPSNPEGGMFLHATKRNR
ncbi:probable cytochrome P450 6a14 [Adelges cooleyi]|uniref:probable cytochrome P450 6a14 n=1 Tax=Adelges cooleyi TaxID=133065 RepID=UPI00217FB894|nr:probable cytochrome P450 6a14 [Adelges cooleyi]